MPTACTPCIRARAPACIRVRATACKTNKAPRRRRLFGEWDDLGWSPTIPRGSASPPTRRAYPARTQEGAWLPPPIPKGAPLRVRRGGDAGPLRAHGQTTGSGRNQEEHTRPVSATTRSARTVIVRSVPELPCAACQRRSDGSPRAQRGTPIREHARLDPLAQWEVASARARRVRARQSFLSRADYHGSRSRSLLPAKRGSLQAGSGGGLSPPPEA